jgi:hypothetical protein
MDSKSIYSNELKEKLVTEVERRSKNILWRKFYPGIALPDEITLSAILDTCYLASFLSEEAVPLKFQIAYGGDELTKDGRTLLVFSDPVPFDSQALRRLSPATDFVDTFIAINGTADEPRGIRIAGIGHAPPNWWTKGAYFHASVPPMPPAMFVRVRGPGSLTIGWGGSSLVSIEHGKMAPRVADFLMIPPLQDFFSEGVTSLAKAAHSDVYDQFPGAQRIELVAEARSLYFDCLKGIIGRARMTSHGALFLVIPHDSASSVLASRSLNVKYPIQGSDPFSLVVAKRQIDKEATDLANKDDVEDADLFRPHYNASKIDPLLTRALSCIGDLGKVDGAVLLTDRLAAIGFGVEIRSNSAISEVVEGVSGHRWSLNPVVRRKSVEGFGTRHRSAFRFCDDHPAVAFILSQDGGIRVAKKEGGEVCHWSEIEPG